jgi:hypothetical protein
MDPIAMSQDYLTATDGICGQGAGERPEASKDRRDRSCAYSILIQRLDLIEP